MSYKVLARKWRPQHFKDLLGQEPVLRALTNALDNDRLHHAYLFTGMRGVGKTTIARIFAKCLNCETRGVSSDPCGECSSCQDIEAGRFFDLIEVDAASKTKVEGTRELLDNVPYAPASGRYKVYLIDEVHMFSNHSFNALLKTLEEPPEHVKFLLATTDPQKVPSTVLSRCLQFNLRRMSSRALVDYLGDLLKKEDITHEPVALDLIARAADGSVRDALSLVEQAAAFGAGTIRVDQVEDMLGRVSIDRILDVMDSLAHGNMASLLEQIEALAQYSPDFHEIMGEMLSLLHQISLMQFVEGSVSDSVPGFARLSEVATQLEADTVQLFYQIGLHARRDMPFAPDPREAFEMALLRMHAFRPVSPARSPVSTSDAPGDARVDAPGDTLSEAEPVTTDQGGAAYSSAARRQGVLAVKGAVSAGGAARTRPAASLGSDQPVEEPSAQLVDTARVDNAHDNLSQPVQTDPVSLTPEHWPELITELDIAGMPMQLASNCELKSFNDNRMLLHLQQDAEHLNAPRFVERLQSAVSQRLAREISLQVVLVSETLQTTPAQLSEQKRSDELAAARASIDQDPVVQQLIRQVDGSVDENSVRPLNGTGTTQS